MRLTKLIDRSDIRKAVKRIASEINEEYKGKTVVLVCPLKGAVVFLSDLIRELNIEVEIDFLRLSSYGIHKRPGEVLLLRDIGIDVKGRDLIVVEDILDTGKTLQYAVDLLSRRSPSSLRVCVLVEKKIKKEHEIKVDYLGFEVPDKFVVGYGMDYAERYRNLKDIYTIE